MSWGGQPGALVLSHVSLSMWLLRLPQSMSSWILIASVQKEWKRKVGYYHFLTWKVGYYHFQHTLSVKVTQSSHRFKGKERDPVSWSYLICQSLPSHQNLYAFISCWKYTQSLPKLMKVSFLAISHVSSKPEAIRGKPIMCVSHLMSSPYFQGTVSSIRLLLLFCRSFKQLVFIYCPWFIIVFGKRIILI